MMAADFRSNGSRLFYFESKTQPPNAYLDVFLKKKDSKTLFY
jgi:hypothetical protein